MEILGCFIPWFIKSPLNQDFSWDFCGFLWIWVRKNGISLDSMGGDHGILMMIWNWIFTSKIWGFKHRTKT